MNATYKITFTPGANQGSWAINALADSCEGSWRNTVDDIGFIDVPVGNAKYLEQLLEADDRVAGYDGNLEELIDESAREAAQAFVDEFGKAYNCATDGDWDAEAFDATPFAKIEDQESVMRWFEKFYADTECVALRKRVAREWNND